MRQRTAALLAGLLGVALPAVAVACPQCAARGPASPGAAALVFGLVGAPYLVAVVVARTIRRAERAERDAERAER
jgi:hypothetical protein